VHPDLFLDEPQNLFLNNDMTKSKSQQEKYQEAFWVLELLLRNSLIVRP